MTPIYCICIVYTTVCIACIHSVYMPYRKGRGYAGCDLGCKPEGGRGAQVVRDKRDELSNLYMYDIYSTYM